MTNENALQAFDLGTIQTMAETVAKSGFFPNINTPEKAATLMMLCHSEGLHPMDALRQYDIIQGRPALKADAMLARFQARGGKWEWQESSDKRAAATATWKGVQTEVEFTMDDAKALQVASRDNWKKQPATMLRKRVISTGIRMAAPEVVLGIYTPEEVEEFAPIKTDKVIDITPPKKAVAELTEPPKKKKKKPAPTKEARENHRAVEGCITAKERKFLWEVAEENGHTLEEFKNFVKRHGYKSTEDIKSDDYTRLLQDVGEGVDPEDAEPEIDSEAIPA